MSGNGWDPVAFEDHDGDAAPRKAGAKRPVRRAKPAAPKAEAPVNLTLALPKEVTDAIWGVAEQQKRTALAIEANTKAVGELIELLRDYHAG